MSFVRHLDSIDSFQFIYLGAQTNFMGNNRIGGRTFWILIEHNYLFRLIKNKWHKNQFKLTEYSTIDIARRLLFLYGFYTIQLRIQYQMTINFLIQTESSV